MIWKVRVIIRSDHGLVCYRAPGTKYWLVVSGTRSDGEASWIDTARNAVRRTTGIPALSFTKHRDRITQVGRDRTTRYRLIYCEALVSDALIIGSILSRSETGEEVQEITFDEARRPGTMDPAQYSTLSALGLLGPHHRHRRA